MRVPGPPSGARLGRATGLAVALTALRLQTMPPGVWHLDQVVYAQTP